MVKKATKVLVFLYYQIKYSLIAAKLVSLLNVEIMILKAINL
jgi:hypothetical protein